MKNKEIKKDEYSLFLFESDEWDNIKEIVERKKLKITINAVKLSRKIYEETGLLVYPVIFRTYASRNMLMAGAFSWTMYQKNEKEVGSIDTVSTCLKKNKQLVVDTSWKDIEIFAEDVE